MVERKRSRMRNRKRLKEEKRENEVWEMVNRKGRKRINEDIELKK